MFGKQNDLADMIGVVRQLPIDRFDHRVRLTADRHRSGKIFLGQPADFIEQRLPAVVPRLHQQVACVVDQFKLGVAMAIGLLTIRRKKVGPSRTEVSGDVPDDQRDRVRLFVDRREKRFIRNLLDRTLS